MRALLTTGGPRIKKSQWRYVEVYGPYQVMLNVDGISIYTRTNVTTDSDQIGHYPLFISVSVNTGMRLDSAD